MTKMKEKEQQIQRKDIFTSIEEYRNAYYPDQPKRDIVQEIPLDEIGKELANKHIQQLKSSLKEWQEKTTANMEKGD